MRLNPYDPDLFDTDAFGNGTSDVIRRNLYVSAVERVLATRQQALGGGADALPTLDMARCLEEEFQECENSHAAHLAYHDLEPCDAGLASLLARSAANAALRAASWTFASGFCLPDTRVRVGNASRRDHLPWAWTGADRPLAGPCDVRCRRLGADGR